MSHVLHRCDEEHCPICDGNLAFCTVCRGGEADLPSDCPGRPMTNEEAKAVQAGRLDFRHGAWAVVGPGRPDD